MSWIWLTLLSALAGAATKILQKQLMSAQAANPAALAFIFQLIVASLFLLYTLATGTFELPNLQNLWLSVVLMALLYGVGNLLTFYAFAKAQASEVAVIFSTSSIWSALAALLLLGESVSGKAWLGIVSIVLGVIAMSWQKTTWHISRGHLAALAAAACFGIAFTNDAFIINQYHSVAAYMVLAFALPSLVVIALQPKALPAVGVFLQPTRLSKLGVCALFYSLAAQTVFLAYKSGGPAALIAPLHQTSLIFTGIFSYIWLKETQRLPQKLLGTGLVFIGALLII